MAYRIIEEENLMSCCKYRKFRFLEDSHCRGESFCSAPCYRPGEEPVCEFQCSEKMGAISIENTFKNIDQEQLTDINKLLESGEAEALPCIVNGEIVSLGVVCKPRR